MICLSFKTFLMAHLHNFVILHNFTMKISFTVTVLTCFNMFYLDFSLTHLDPCSEEFRR
jgi:hypothetical protein